jgi:hypothetical protein
MMRTRERAERSGAERRARRKRKALRPRSAVLDRVNAVDADVTDRPTDRPTG